MEMRGHRYHFMVDVEGLSCALLQIGAKKKGQPATDCLWGWWERGDRQFYLTAVLCNSWKASVLAVVRDDRSVLHFLTLMILSAGIAHRLYSPCIGRLPA